MKHKAIAGLIAACMATPLSATTFTCQPQDVISFRGDPEFVNSRMEMIYLLTPNGQALGVTVDVQGDDRWQFEEDYILLRETEEGEAHWIRTNAANNGQLALPTNATLMAMPEGETFNATVLMQGTDFVNATLYSCMHSGA